MSQKAHEGIYNVYGMGASSTAWDTFKQGVTAAETSFTRLYTTINKMDRTDEYDIDRYKTIC